MSGFRLRIKPMPPSVVIKGFVEGEPSSDYEKRSMIITTNTEFSKWGVVFGDDKLASALIDRLMHHGRLVEFGGGSKRMENALMLGRSDR